MFYLCESEATATNVFCSDSYKCFICAKAKRQQQMFSVAKAKRQQQMFYLCESEATATNVFCSESEAAATKRSVGTEINPIVFAGTCAKGKCRKR
ncbi:hypothetical protein [Lysinibacillus xylanilyticus]|uniref:hypothetical protein n=1 Tax=Lysinibacillus xylanilyticus TaxID=582475 RepID=UPI003D09208C